MFRISEGESISKVALSYDANPKQLRYFLVKYRDYKPPQRKYLNKEKITKRVLHESYELYSTGEYSITAISEKFKVNRKKLSKMLKEEYGITVRQDGKKLINSFFFHNIDTHEKAYWLGILFSDGYTDGNRVELCIKDKEHVEKFKRALQSSHTVSEKKIVDKNGNHFTAWRISFHDKQLASDLCSLGCVPNKSLILKLPVLPEPLLSSFFRGFYDGDGSVTYYEDKSALNLQITSGSEMVLEQIAWYLRGKLELDSIVIEDSRSETTKKLHISSTDGACKFLDYIYQHSNESSRLDRKHEIYMQFKLPSLLETTEE
mgnify:CR=1 FL=1